MPSRAAPCVPPRSQVLAAGLQWFELPEAWYHDEQPLLREALGAVRDFAAAVEARPLPQLPRDLPGPHPVWGAASQPQSNAARQALLVMLLSAGGLCVEVNGGGAWGLLGWSVGSCSMAHSDV